jgi:aminoglycoside phosphotransferase (APT) family kinase protein
MMRDKANNHRTWQSHRCQDGECRIGSSPCRHLAGPPVWFHGDVSWGNLLVEDGRMSAVIDFGTSRVGDPSCDLARAGSLFEGESREVFRTGLAVDQATWARGRGWGLWKVLITVAGHTNNQAEVEKSGQVIGEVLADCRNSA